MTALSNMPFIYLCISNYSLLKHHMKFMELLSILFVSTFRKIQITLMLSNSTVSIYFIVVNISHKISSKMLYIFNDFTIFTLKKILTFNSSMNSALCILTLCSRKGVALYLGLKISTGHYKQSQVNQASDRIELVYIFKQGHLLYNLETYLCS